MASFDITNLGSYVQNSGNQYAVKSVASAKTAKALIDSKNVQVGVKGTAAILKLDSNVSLIKNAGCTTRTAGSSIVLSSRNIVVNQIADQGNICPATLWNTFYADSLAKGAVPQEELLPVFADAIMNDRALKIAAANEKLIWQGDESLTGTTNLKQINGILKAVTATTALTGATIINKLQMAFTGSNVDNRNQEDFKIFIGEDTYATYRIALANANIFQAQADDTLFGTTAKLFVTSGLNGTGKAFATRLSNLQLGLDGAADADKATMRYSVETGNFYQDFAYSLGVAVVYIESTEVFVGTGV